MADDLDKAIRQIAQMFGASQSSSDPADDIPESAEPRQTGSGSSLMQNYNTDVMQDNLGILSKARGNDRFIQSCIGFKNKSAQFHTPFP